jgi:colanic acid/amylovoran biosynthesis glycosyltransferase
LGSFKPIILHSHFATVAVGHRNLRRLARDRYDCPTVCSFYGYDLKGLIPGQRWEGFDDLLREEVAFIVQGPRMAEHMAELGVDAAKLHLNPLGIDLSLFPQRTTKYVDGTLRVLTIGRFVEKKGIDDAIRAVSLAHRRGLKIHLTVVGDGPLRSSIEDVIAVEKAGESVTLMGAVEYELLRRAYYEHDVCLQPSVTAADGDTEGGANMCIIEAMAAGLPIVATRHADTETTVSEGVNAFLADERRPDQLATALCDLARDPDLWNDFSIAGRSRACLLFDANRQAVDLERTYDRIRRAWSGA